MDMKNEILAAGIIRRKAREQRNGVHANCPRCGCDCMDDDLSRNALSRQIDVIVCDACGTDEAIRAYSGEPPIPFSEWAAVTGFKEVKK